MTAYIIFVALSSLTVVGLIVLKYHQDKISYLKRLEQHIALLQDNSYNDTQTYHDRNSLIKNLGLSEAILHLLVEFRAQCIVTSHVSSHIFNNNKVRNEERNLVQQFVHVHNKTHLFRNSMIRHREMQRIIQHV